MVISKTGVTIGGHNSCCFMVTRASVCLLFEGWGAELENIYFYLFNTFATIN